jgi:cell division protein FtsL
MMRRRGTERRPARRSRSAFWAGLAAVVYAAITITGVQTARQSHDLRQIYQQLSATQTAKDQQLEEYRLLLLERATFAAHQNVDRVAAEQLGMLFPENVVEVER